MSRASRREARRRVDMVSREWKGPYRPYDLVKEFVIALGAVLALTVLLTILFSSPDLKPSTVRSWAVNDPKDFASTAAMELDGSSPTGMYGPPYNHASSGQHMLFIRPQKWLGVSHPIDTAQDFVLTPLRSITGQPALQAAVSRYQAAPDKQQAAWTSAYEDALKPKSADVRPDGLPTNNGKLVKGAYGPVPLMMRGLTGFAQSGGLDGALLTSKQFYQTDYTKPLLFMSDGGVLSDRAEAEHLLGKQWGIMNETGAYPGQVWLWLYTFWYQVKPFSSSANADILVMTMMLVLSLALVLIPFIPGVNALPRWIPIHKLIWRDHYRAAGKAPGPSG